MRKLESTLYVAVMAIVYFNSFALAEQPKGKVAKEPRTTSSGTAASGALPDRLATAPIMAAAPAGRSVSDGQVAVGGSNACLGSEAIAGTGFFAFDNSTATTDGLEHAACNFLGAQIENDVWYCWTAPQQACTGVYSISTCGRTTVDTKIAVYNGCSCPTNDANLLSCSDDDCSLQTRVTFNATPGQTYLIRLGNYPGEPGGEGTFAISCELPAPCSEPASHCQSADQSDGVNSERSKATTADGFTPTQSGNINSVCWWGAYLTDDPPFTNCTPGAADSFRVRYLTDVDGLPGAQIASFSQQAGTLNMDPRYLTNLIIDPTLEEYEYHATHANVPVTAGNCYWVEITNEVTGCQWYWETGLDSDGRAIQDGDTGSPPNGYQLTDVIVGDMAFCTNLEITLDTETCLPPPPPNDNCGSALAINGQGTFLLDTAMATTDGPDHTSCLFTFEEGIARDGWFRWTSTCSGDVLVRTCNSTTVDTKIAVYNGTTCPTTANNPIACNDDLCGSQGFQSMLVFQATPSQQFLIRAGSYPGEYGGVMGIVISCGAPNNPVCGASLCIGGSDDGDICTSNQDCADGGECVAPGGCCGGGVPNFPSCAEESCCELVCACDPFCCETDWDSDCASHGLGQSGCGAADLCDCAGCGSPAAGACCTGHQDDQPGCNDEACCEAVCACDPFCCGLDEPNGTGYWDGNCAGDGFEKICEGTLDNCETSADCAPGVDCIGCGARALCSDLCSATPTCPPGTILFTDPPHLAVDARRPHPQGAPTSREGFKEFKVTGPPGAALSCWSVQETEAFGAANTISSVIENPAGTYTVTLNRVITAGAGTSITYTPTSGLAAKGCFKSHPGNVNSDGGTLPSDIIDIVDNINGVRTCPGTQTPCPLQPWQCDLDRSTQCLPADIITLIDMLIGNGYSVWNGDPLPTGPAGCP